MVKIFDLSKPNQKNDFYKLVERNGAFNHFVNCAGTLELGGLCDMSIEQVDHTFMVNAFGVLTAIQAIAEAMKATVKSKLLPVTLSRS